MFDLFFADDKGCRLLDPKVKLQKRIACLLNRDAKKVNVLYLLSSSLKNMLVTKMVNQVLGLLRTVDYKAAESSDTSQNYQKSNGYLSTSTGSSFQYFV